MITETILEKQSIFFAEHRLNWDIDKILDNQKEYQEKISVFENIFMVAYIILTSHMQEKEKENFLIHNGAKVVELANKMLV